MHKKVTREWNLGAPWGNLAMVSWGDPGRPPVLLVHGFTDTAATFIPLVGLLPDTYYYVAFDLPGHGLSDPSPGPPVSYMHFVECIRLVVEELQWSTFVCIVHSLGYLISSCYNAVFPGRMSKLVNLDGSISIGLHDMTDYHNYWFQRCYESCYRNCFATSEPVTYTYDEAMSILIQSRAVNSEVAAILATRCLAPTADGTFRFTWDPKVRKISTTLFSFDQLFAILASNPPTLNIVASEVMLDIYSFRAFTEQMMTKLQDEVENYYVLTVEGTHAVHLTNPESLVENIVEFLERDFSVKSKL